MTLCVLIGLHAHGQKGVSNILEEEGIERLLDVYHSVKTKDQYYQIQVGFGTQAQAMKLKSEVEIDFPGWYTKIEFQQPTYRVRLGRFSNRLEAERKFREVRKKYPNAMLLKPV